MIPLCWLLLGWGVLGLVRVAFTRRTGDDVYCRYCKHNLSGTWPAQRTCQECGAELAPEKVVRGRKVWPIRRAIRSAVWIAAATLGLVLTVNLARMGRPIATWYPERVLLTWYDWTGHSSAFDALVHRAETLQSMSTDGAVEFLQLLYDRKLDSPENSYIGQFLFNPVVPENIRRDYLLTGMHSQALAHLEQHTHSDTSFIRNGEPIEPPAAIQFRAFADVIPGVAPPTYLSRSKMLWIEFRDEDATKAVNPEGADAFVWQASPGADAPVKLGPFEVEFRIVIEASPWCGVLTQRFKGTSTGELDVPIDLQPVSPLTWVDAPTPSVPPTGQ